LSGGPQEPIDIDVGRQLFVDDALVARTDLQRTFHSPTPDVGNPIFVPTTEVERNGGVMPTAAIASVLHDPADGLFKMWYMAGYDDGFAYATSADGLEWRRPRLDIVPGTNLFLKPRPGYVRNAASVWIDHAAADRAGRFKMFAFHRAGTGSWPRATPFPAPPDAEVAHLFTSADGIHWNERVRTGPCGDNTTLFPNPFRNVWAYSIRTFEGKRGRARSYHEHHDFLASARWQEGEPSHWLEADVRDRPDPVLGYRPELYKMDCVAYESLMLGMFALYRGPPNHVASETGVPKTLDLEAGFSRDGLSWDRPCRSAFLAASRSPGRWDRGYLHASGGVCLVVGDELRFYYSGFSGISPAQGGGPYAGGRLGVARLRRDGFASMDGPGVAMPPVTRTGSRRAMPPDYEEPEGTLTTRVVQFSGAHLFVNVDVFAGGLRVEVLDPDGVPIEGFGRDACRGVTDNATKAEVTWRDTRLASLAGRPVRFRFHLASGRLYSFWVSASESGASGGYVAAGGPGFVAGTDTTGA